MNQVGSCPKCGAPVYAPDNWMSIMPPPSYPTCMCNYQGQAYTVTITDGQVQLETDAQILREVCKEFKDAVLALKEIVDGLKDRQKSV